MRAALSFGGGGRWHAVAPWLASLAVLLPVAHAQPTVFQLQIPDFGDQLFEGNVVEVPGRYPSKLVFRLLNPVAADVDYGKILTKLNGESATYITTTSNSDTGKLVYMNLKLRSGMTLVPGANTVEITAINRRGRHFYKNFILRTREGARNEYFAYDLKTSPNDENGAPPDVLVFEPEFPVVFQPREKQRMIMVKGSASALHPIDLLSVQGKPIPAGTDRVEFEGQVAVAPSDTAIVLEAADQMGNRTTVTIPVARASNRKTVLTGERYALAVGLSRYAPKGLPALPVASLDARAFANLLESKGGFSHDHVLLMTDDQANYQQLQNAFRNFVARPKPDDLLVVYFEGYGLHDPSPDNPENIYLAAYDTHAEQVRDTAIGIDWLKTTLMASVRSKHAVFLFDVGHTLGGPWSQRTNNLVNDYLLRMFPGDAGKAVMVGEGVNEIASESTGQGLFTKCLSEAAERADWNHDGVITVREWFQYVAHQVRNTSKSTQNPLYAAQSETPIFSAGL